MQYIPPGRPGRPGSIVEVAPRYENFIGGKWLAPTEGHYRTDVSPVDGSPIAEIASSTPADVELALDAAHAAKDAWGGASATERAAVLNAIADAITANAEMLAVAESWENGKPVRETLAAEEGRSTTPSGSRKWFSLPAGDGLRFVTAPSDITAPSASTERSTP